MQHVGPVQAAHVRVVQCLQVPVGQRLVAGRSAAGLQRVQEGGKVTVTTQLEGSV